MSDAVAKVREAHENGFQPIASDVETLLAEIDRLRKIERVARDLCDAIERRDRRYGLTLSTQQHYEHLASLLDQKEQSTP